MRVPAKLIGGRYDGDQGSMIVPRVPEYLWAYECPHGRDCPSGTIHWAWIEAAAAHHASAEAYVHTGFDGVHDEMPVAVYVAAPDRTPIDVLREGDLAHAA